jgi:acetylornithine deacetylase/succinyl-diaminopimelate desuccinylase-like protein
MSDWLKYLTDNQTRFENDLTELLRIPSISAQGQHVEDVLAAADWVADRFARLGFEHIQTFPTGKHKAVYADWLHAPGKPILLLYGHFDVQPVDPLDEWVTPPFEPKIEADRITARGASDMKGNLVESLIAIEALMKTTGALPVNIKFLSEGQEEIGSPDLAPVVEANRTLLESDFVINTDAGQYTEEQPMVLLGGRGVAVVELHVKGPDADLHSGLYGGAVQNPIHALVQLLDSLHTHDGKVAVEGFYDAVVTVSEEERVRFPPDNDEEFMRVAGVKELFGESGFTTYERTTMRPTLEINGIWGGYLGDGVKTIVPSSAHAKITCRLVANQEPKDIVELIQAHVNKNIPPGVDAALYVPGLEARPFTSSMHAPGNLIAANVLSKIYGRRPYFMRLGGSIPILDVIDRVLGRQAIAFGFSLGDEKFHSPNEFLRLSSFRRGQAAYCELLEAFGE